MWRSGWTVGRKGYLPGRGPWHERQMSWGLGDPGLPVLGLSLPICMGAGVMPGALSELHLGWRILGPPSLTCHPEPRALRPCQAGLVHVK